MTTKQLQRLITAGVFSTALLSGAAYAADSMSSSAAPAAKLVAAVGGHQNTGGRPATPITSELMQRGEAALAPIIGPLASVLVTRYASVAENSRDFFERLAGHLRTPEERDVFFMNIRGSGGVAAAPH